MTQSELELLVTSLAAPIRAYVAKHVEPLERRNTELELRIKHLEARPALKFQGVFEPGKSYAPGDACTFHGGLWICRAETIGQPGQDYQGWQLAVKSRSIA
jgi:hypothetical protein